MTISCAYAKQQLYLYSMSISSNVSMCSDTKETFMKDFIVKVILTFIIAAHDSSCEETDKHTYRNHDQILDTALAKVHQLVLCVRSTR